MGSLVSRETSPGRSVEHATSESGTMGEPSEACVDKSAEVNEEFHDSINEDEARAKVKEDEMEEFKKQLLIKREQRKEILDRHRAEKAGLEKSLDNEIKAKLEAYETNKALRELLIQNNIEIPEHLQSSKENSDITDTIVQMREEFDKLKASNKKLRMDLVQANSALQSAYSDIADLSLQNTESIKQIHALREVVAVSKTMINLREQQLTELKNKLNEIERSLADREASMLSTDLRQEYERQLQNIRTLRGLYEERARLAEITRQGLVRDLEEQRRLNNIETNKSKDLAAKVEELEAKVEELCEKIENKNNEIVSCQGETRGLQDEMAVINKLFSQVLLGYKTKQDLDKLVHRLEENRGILTHMAEQENGSEASTALPKMLLELINQIEDNEEIKHCESKSVTEEKVEEVNTSQESDTQTSNPTSAEEIVENLPKVWRVLMELLSHQSTPEESTSEKVTTCYKSVETKSGPVLVPSVSQTYIRLKDLIVEKLALIKEVNRMKQLNSHLESCLGEQERKLCLVTTELSKTWHVVGRLRKHHHQLHTHEKILKYELQQKRKLLNELKEELAYCKEKWDQAREKNSQSEIDFRKLRTEFLSRKTKNSFNNSAESGYSDERPSDESSESNDESDHVTEPLKRSKKKFKKSFETIVDSSTNCAAEREDPASDLIDVADLPLDTHDDDDNNESCNSESCHTESLLKSEKINEETEDEIEDIANNSCTEDSSVVNCGERENQNAISEVSIATEPTRSTVLDTLPENIPAIDPITILKSIVQQNERLAKREQKLDQLEKSSESLLKQTQTTVNRSNQIDSTLDHILNRPSSSKQSESGKILNSAENSEEYKEDEIAKESNDVTKDEEIKQNTSDQNTPQKSCESTDVTKDEETKQNISDQNTSQKSCEPIDFKAILENVKLQNERLAKKDERLQKLEEGCSEVVHNISNTIEAENEIIEKLDNLHSGHEIVGSTSSNQSDEQSTYEKVEKDHSPTEFNRDSSEPSTSSDTDHEARFAARDLRLKRLEEQTKNLVTKVNKTTSKGVKINYKLEELHSLYGSENSRAGTPSEDNDDTSESQNIEDDDES